jgi:heptosyltransferase-3
MSLSVGSAEIRSILYINVSRIGDTLLITPAVRAVAKAFPDAKLTLLGHPKRAEIFENLPFVSRVGQISKYRALWQGRILRSQFDLAFVCGNDRALIEYALRVSDRVVAFEQADPALNRRLFARGLHPEFQTEHAVRIQLRLPAAIGVEPDGFGLAYVVSPQESDWARAQLKALGSRARSPLVGLQVASFPTKAYRDWPLEHFVALVDRLRVRWPGAHFLIFGGQEESGRTMELARHLGPSASLYAGRISLRQTAALMNELDLYVGVDTGPTHIMGALHRPMVALYHGYSPSRVLAPLEHPCAYVVDHPLADKGATPATPMADISVDVVWMAVERALAEHPPRMGAS